MIVGVAIIGISLTQATALYLFRVGRDAAAAYDRYKVVIEIEGSWPWQLGAGKEWH